MKKLAKIFLASLLFLPAIALADRGITVSTTGIGSAGDITGVTAGDGLQGGGTVGTVTLTLSPDATSYIQNKGSNQNAQFNVASGTVRGPLTVGTITSTTTASLSTITASTITTGGLAVTSDLTLTHLGNGVLQLVGSEKQAAINLVSLSTQVTGTISLSTQVAGTISLSTQVAGTISLSTQVFGTLPVANLTANATNYLRIPTTGTISASHGITGTTGTFSIATAGSTQILTASNSDNTNGASNSKALITTGGGSGGDPSINWLVTGVTNWSMGIDNSDSDALVVSESANIGTNNRLRVATGGDISVPAGDLYTTAWTNYFNSSTIVGWSSFTQSNLYYKKIGKMVFVQVFIQGTSNSVNTTFTLPHAVSILTDALIRVTDNGTTSTGPGLIEISAGGSTATCYTTPAGATWTNSGTKAIFGQFFYEAQ